MPVAPLRGAVIEGRGTTQGGSVVGGARVAGAVTGSGAGLGAVAARVRGGDLPGSPQGAARQASWPWCQKLAAPWAAMRSGGGNGNRVTSFTRASHPGTGNATPVSTGGGAVAGSVAATVVVEA